MLTVSLFFALASPEFSSAQHKIFEPSVRTHMARPAEKGDVDPAVIESVSIAMMAVPSRTRPAILANTESRI